MVGVGDIVLFRLGLAQVGFINKARVTWVGTGQKPAGWIPGTMAHVGRPVHEGQLLPMVVIEVHEGEVLDGQVFLPGNDTMDAPRIHRGDGFAMWRPKL